MFNKIKEAVIGYMECEKSQTLEHIKGLLASVFMMTLMMFILKFIG